METNDKRLISFKATHPGEILREELRERGIRQKDFAEQIGMQASHLNAFIKGRRKLNEDLAIKLEKHLGIPYEIWMNLHAGYLYECKTSGRPEQNNINFNYLRKAIFDIARKLSAKGMSTEDISEVTGLTAEEILML